MTGTKYAEGSFGIISGTPTEVLFGLREEGVKGSDKIVGFDTDDDEVRVMFFTGASNVIAQPYGLWEFNSSGSFSAGAITNFLVYNTGTNSNYEGIAMSGSAINISGCNAFDDVHNNKESHALHLSGHAATLAANVAEHVILSGSNADLDNAQQGTVAAWVKRDVIGVDQAIWTYTEPDVNNKCLSLYISDDTAHFMYASGTSTLGSSHYIVSGTTAIPNKTWNHIAVTSNGTVSGTSLYVNGVKEHRLSEGGNNAGQWTGDIADGDFQEYVGVSICGTFMQKYFTGSIDNLRVYTYCLTGDQVKELYTNRL